MFEVSKNASFQNESFCIKHFFDWRSISGLKRRPLATGTFTVGCGKNFLNLCHHEIDFSLTAEWNFFATSHGKGPCDGLGGTLKRLATKASLQRCSEGLNTEPILTPMAFFEFCKENTSINCVFTTYDDYSRS